MSKRQRSSSPTANEGTVTSGSPVRSQSVWFEDGNIILQAENTQFKVHRGVLAKHSPIFADLFKVPQPTDEPVVDGCPVVQIPDTAGDVSNMLCSLYGDNDTIRHNGLLQLHVVESMVRLGKKYQIDHLCKEGLRCLQLEFPKTLAAYDRLDPDHLFTNFSTKDALAPVFAILKLAHECGIQSILPALYLYATGYRLDVLLNHPEAPSLPFDAVRNLACGRDVLLQAWMDQSRRLFDDDSEDRIPNHDCTSWSQCSAISEALPKVLSQRPPDLSSVFLKWNSFAGEWYELREVVYDDFCKACMCRMQDYHDDRTRHLLWTNLPSYFKLPAWGALKDLEG